MNKTREVRELQLSSTQLIILFLSILVLGVFIFLLGVSVGKKQAALSQEAGLQRRPAASQVRKPKPAVPTEKPGSSPIEKEIASHSQTPSSTLPMSQPGGTAVKPAEPSSKTTAQPQTSGTKPPAAAQAKPSTQAKTPAVKTPAKTQTTTAPRPAAAKSAVPVKGQYYIQLAAFDDRRGAEEYAVNIRAAGFPTLILSPLPTDRTPWFRVRVGGYASREDAEKAVYQLKAALSNKKLEYWITRE